MKVLHLFANFKWTGPADPAIRSAVELARRGHDVRFAKGEWRNTDDIRLDQQLEIAGLPLVEGLELRKHFHLRSHLRDARRLRGILAAEAFDVLHCHMPADHLITALALRHLDRRPVVVRSLYEPTAPRKSWRTRLAFRHTDGVVTPTRQCQQEMVSRWGFEPDRVLYQDPPVATVRRAMTGDLRDALGIRQDEFVIGITARIQPHRRFDLLWETARRVADQRPKVRFVLLGRGGERDVERLVKEPVRRLGLERTVVLPGYLVEPEYSLALRTFDLFMFLVPGSDGTCRAVGEAMALGLPLVTTRRGILPELTGPHPEIPECGPSGIACDEDPDAMAAAIVSLIDDSERRRALGAASLARVSGPMDPAGAARRLSGFYEELLVRAEGPAH